MGLGAGIFPSASRALLALAVLLVTLVPLPSLRASAAADPIDAEPHTAPIHVQPVELRDPEHPATERFTDLDLAVTIVPPAGWQRSPLTSLNPQSDPPEPVQESARFQLRLLDPSLYAAPIPITSGLVADAGAVISIGVAREGSDILLMDRGARGTREVASVPGFTMIEDEAIYEGLHVLTRYLFSRDSDRVLVARAAAPEAAWPDLEKDMRASLATFSGDPKGANAPAPAPPPPPPAPEPAAPVEAPDPTIAIRNTILERAATLLGLRYVWGGNSTVNGMDCSAYVSWVWGVPRYSTDSIWNVSFPISKGELLPGDALNLTTGRDPQHLGHIRLFEAWANAAHTAMWVFEETPPRVVHRVVAYDDRYQPIRLYGLSGAGEARLIPATPAPETPAPAPFATRRPTVAPTRTAFRTPTPRPTTRTTVRPTPTPLRTATPRTGTTTIPLPARTPVPTFNPAKDG